MISRSGGVGYAGLFAGAVLLILTVACQSTQSGEVVPTQVSQELHEGDHLSSYSQEITSAIHAFDVKPGGTYILQITAKNTGTQPWYGQAPTARVDASYRWIDSKGNTLPIEGNRVALNHAILRPGESDQLELKVTAPPTPGPYSLSVSMVQEGVDWFFARGTKPLLIQVNVG